jgi:hypothetical protein
MSRCKSWGRSSVFEWLCCVCSQTRLGPGPRQQGRQVQEEGFPTLGTERSAEWRGRSAAEVCTSVARKIGVPLVARQGRSHPQQASFPCIGAKRRDCFGSCSSGGRSGQELMGLEGRSPAKWGKRKTSDSERPKQLDTDRPCQRSVT